MSISSSRSATSDTHVGKKTVNCPQCGKNVVWDATSRFRPFCSERCKMIDLGAWATESYRIPVQEDNDALEEDEGGEAPPRN
jgi:endogenous inhibitor of DNA gyrase (YacG/DUF329 family)